MAEGVQVYHAAVAGPLALLAVDVHNGSILGAAALEFAADRATKAGFDPALKVGARIAAAALEEGMIARAIPHGYILGFAPPLVLSREEADSIVAVTKRAVERVHAGL